MGNKRNHKNQVIFCPLGCFRINPIYTPSTIPLQRMKDAISKTCIYEYTYARFSNCGMERILMDAGWYRFVEVPLKVALINLKCRSVARRPRRSLSPFHSDFWREDIVHGGIHCRRSNQSKGGSYRSLKGDNPWERNRTTKIRLFFVI